MKFSIRDLAWLTLVVALVLGWYLDVVRINARHDEQLNEILNAQLDAGNRAIKANLWARQVETVHGQAGVPRRPVIWAEGISVALLPSLSAKNLVDAWLASVNLPSLTAPTTR